MSLALNVVASPRRAGRLAQALAVAMCATLLMSAWTGWQEAQAAGVEPRRWWLPLACVIACLACCLPRRGRAGAGEGPQRSLRGFFRNQPARDRALRLFVAPDGAAQVVPTVDAAPIAAEVVGAWRLGSVVYLRLRPAGARRDCHFLLSRADLAPDQWHGLRRWQVWLRRSLNAHRTNARSA